MARPRTVVAPRVAKDVTVDAANILAVTANDETVTVKGLVKGAPVIVWAESLTANISISNAHCSAKDTLKFRLLNPTAGAINPASQTFRVVQF
jgi:hypothetical protein